MRNKAQVIDHIRSSLDDLSRLADAHRWSMLTYLFRIARLETDRMGDTVPFHRSTSPASDRTGPSGYWDWDVTHDRMFSDEHTASLFNLDKDAARRGTPLSDWQKVIHPDDADHVTAQFMNSIETGSEYNPRFRVVARDGDIRHLEASGRCLFDAQGRPTRFPGTVRQVAAQSLTLTEVEIELIMQRGRQTH